MYEDWENEYEDEDEELDNPGTELVMENPPMSEILTAENPNREDAAEAMSIAGQLRGEGLSASDALRQAWSEVKGESNPASSFEPSPLVIGLGAAVVGVLIWKKIKGFWPWQAAQIAKRSAIQRASMLARRAAVAKKASQGDISFQGYSSLERVQNRVQSTCQNNQTETVSLILP